VTISNPVTRTNSAPTQRAPRRFTVAPSTMLAAAMVLIVALAGIVAWRSITSDTTITPDEVRRRHITNRCSGTGGSGHHHARD